MLLALLTIGCCQNTQKIPPNPSDTFIIREGTWVKLVVENVSKYPIVGYQFHTRYKDELGEERDITVDSHRRTLPMQTDTIYIAACNMACLSKRVYFLVGKDVVECTRLADMCSPSNPPKRNGIVLFSVDYDYDGSNNLMENLKYDSCIIE